MKNPLRTYLDDAGQVVGHGGELAGHFSDALADAFLDFVQVGGLFGVNKARSCLNQTLEIE